jgi:hypothetical protein
MSKATFKAQFVKNFDGAYSNVLPVKGAIGDLAEYIFDYMLKANVETVSDDKTLDVDDSGKIFLVDTNDKTITLPAVADVGEMKVTIVNAGADAGVEVTISPDEDDAIFGSVPAPTGGNDDASTEDGLISAAGGADNTDFINTKATANKGDRLTLVSDGSTGWYIVGGVGIWADEQ